MNQRKVHEWVKYSVQGGRNLLMTFWEAIDCKVFYDKKQIDHHVRENVHLK